MVDRIQRPNSNTKTVSIVSYSYAKISTKTSIDGKESAQINLKSLTRGLS